MKNKKTESRKQKSAAKTRISRITTERRWARVSDGRSVKRNTWERTYRMYGWLKNGEYPTCREFRIIGTCPAPVAGLANITQHYANCFGPPPAGRRIFLRASTMVSGFESLPREFRARVPAS